MRDDTFTPLDSGMAQFGKALSEATPPGAELWPLQQQRDAWNGVCRAFRSPRPDDVTVEDVVANGVPTRLFTPLAQGPHAGVVYSHGGGWVLGGPDTHDDMCAEMASGAQCVVALTDYRLAPEHPHPAQLEDSLKVWRWLRDQTSVDANRMIAAGDSAGGQMSAALALTLRDLGLPQLKAMVLIYPGLGANFDTSSYRRNANAPGLTRSEMMFYLTAFLGPEGSPAWSDEKALPLLAQNLEGLPPAFITVAGHDPLHDDGVMFHERLLRAGISSQLRREPALGHSYMRARHHSPVAFEAFQTIVTALKQFSV
jgi:acetyl esterase